MFKEKERTREQSVLYLVLWLVFIFIFLIAIKINSSKNPVVEEVKPQYITVDKGFERLNANNYEYNYVITNGEDKTYYTGVIDGNVNTGTKIYKDEVINYVNNGINTIDINTNETVDIYGDILYEFLNPNNLYNYLKNIKYIIKEEDIEVLLNLGKEHLYVFEKDETMMHENDAAEILCNRTRAVQS